jgi:hypothetical protein
MFHGGGGAELNLIDPQLANPHHSAEQRSSSIALPDRRGRVPAAPVGRAVRASARFTRESSSPQFVEIRSKTKRFSSSTDDLSKCCAGARAGAHASRPSPHSGRAQNFAAPTPFVDISFSVRIDMYCI